MCHDFFPIFLIIFEGMFILKQMTQLEKKLLPVQIAKSFKLLSIVFPPQSVVVPITETNSTVYVLPAVKFGNVRLFSAVVD